MPKIIGYKTSANANNTRLGYAKAILIKDDQTWELSDSNNVPKRGEVFITGNFEGDVDNKYEQGALFEADVELVDNPESSSCEYFCYSNQITSPSRGTGLTLIFEIAGSITANRILEIRSPIRPANFAYFSCVGDSSPREIVGPFEVASARFDQPSRDWQVTFRIPSTANLSSFGLEPYSIFRADIDTVPTGAILDLGNFSTDQGLILAGFKLSDEFKVINAPTQLFIDNRTLVGLVDEGLSPTSRFGRRGRRDLISQIEAAKNLKPFIKDRALSMFEEVIEIRDAVIQNLIESGEIDAPQGDLLTSKDAQDLTEFKQENIKLNEQNKDLASRNRELEEKIKSVDESALTALQNTIQQREEDIKVLKKNVDLEKNYEKISWELENASKDLTAIKDETSKLEEVKSTLKRQILQDDRAFRDKALEVIPFLNILSSSSEQGQLLSSDFSQEPDDYQACDENFLITLKDRMLETGYKAKQDFLICSLAATFVSRFAGVYGDPGTGKTTFAKCFAAALGKKEKSSTFVNVGKGWSSHSDFLGYANTFIDQFKFQNQFFTQFQEPLESDYKTPLRTVILDEASLSSVDSYLSDFMSIENGFQNQKIDEINLSGKPFYFPPDFRFLLTFNFDENTETLPRKFLDRMPLIHCTANDEEGNFVIDDEMDFKPFEAKSVFSFMNALFLSETQDRQDYLSQYQFFVEKWDLVNAAGPRKRMQIDQFLRLISLSKSVDEAYLLDFISQTFLLPNVIGQGDIYRNNLEKLSQNLESLVARKAIEKMLETGERFLQYRYL